MKQRHVQQSARASDSRAGALSFTVADLARINVSVDVDVDVDVSAPVIVAALVNGNDTVDVIDAVSDDTTGGWERRSLGRCSTPRARRRLITPQSSTASITSTASFPFTSAATITGALTSTSTSTSTTTATAAGLRLQRSPVLPTWRIWL